MTVSSHTFTLTISQSCRLVAPIRSRNLYNSFSISRDNSYSSPRRSGYLQNFLDRRISLCVTIWRRYWSYAATPIRSFVVGSVQGRVSIVCYECFYDSLQLFRCHWCEFCYCCRWPWRRLCGRRRHTCAPRFRVPNVLMHIFFFFAADDRTCAAYRGCRVHFINYLSPPRFAHIINTIPLGAVSKWTVSYVCRIITIIRRPYAIGQKIRHSSVVLFTIVSWLFRDKLFLSS